jgi:microcompartment protein CcmL/EutN
MANTEAIGIIELTSVGIGHLVEDAMLKAASVRALMARTICSGKFIVIVGGQIGAVRSSMQAGLAAAPDGVIDQVEIPNVHNEVFKAVSDMVQVNMHNGQIPSLGIIETFSAASAIEAADAAAKAADVQLFRIHLAMALGGKGLVMMSGSVADCKAAVAAGAEVVKEKGLLVSAVTIPRPSKELFGERL